MRCPQSFLVCLFSLAVFSCQSSSAKKNWDLPHPHKGILTPYEAGPFDLELEGDDLENLKAGKSVMKQAPAAKDGEMAGGAICVQDIDAPKEAVWAQILDLDSYKGKVPKVNQCENYAVKKNEDGTFNIKTKMVVGVVPGYSVSIYFYCSKSATLQFFYLSHFQPGDSFFSFHSQTLNQYTTHYDHTYNAEKGSVTWQLDYEKTNDFDDVSGHWHCEEHPDDPNCTRVFYACDLKLKGKVPKPVFNYLSKSALRTATGWVKKESEANPNGKIPVAFVTEESPAPVN